MATDQARAPQALSAEDAEVAVDILRALLAQEFAETRWDEVERLINALKDAVAAGNFDAFDAAVVELELVGPIRVTRLGSIPVVPPPSRVRERVNRLIHELVKPSSSPQEPNDRPARH
ncbi:CATRA system-associated protein [Micromonospora sp. NPDC049101]|uniref:CATRA system-associated protein n=1 Tax=Micromonospora sp. NPDC049101 TaxID=3155032 RepID=UPI0033CBE962